MSYLRSFLFYFLIPFAFASLPLRADDNNILSQEKEQKIDKIIIKRVNNYLNNLKGFRAEIKQFNGNGGYIKGSILIKDRGSIRINYENPDNSIIYDGRRIIHLDNDIGEVSFLSASNTPFSFLLNQRENVDIARDFFVAKLRRHERDDKAFIFLLPKDFAKDQKGTDSDQNKVPDFQLILVFKNASDDKKIELDSWALIEGGNQYTRVELSNIKKGVVFDASLFRYQRSTL